MELVDGVKLELNAAHEAELSQMRLELEKTKVERAEAAEQHAVKINELQKEFAAKSESLAAEGVSVDKLLQD